MKDWEVNRNHPGCFAARLTGNHPAAFGGTPP
jgi:hypothetical protein